MLLTPESRLDSERGNLSISGQRGINTNVTVDGVDYNNAFFGGTTGAAEGRAPLSISQESIKEFSVITNGASAEFGRSGGGFVNVITKNGTNNLHGSGFYYNQPQSLISDFAKPEVLPGTTFTGTPSPPTRRRTSSAPRSAARSSRTSSSTSCPTTTRSRTSPCRSRRPCSTRRSSPGTRRWPRRNSYARPRTATSPSDGSTTRSTTRTA